MTKDCFALLSQPRQPWLDSDLVKASFLEKSSEVHPDRFHNAPPERRQAAAARFADLNEAHQRLREPKDRLRHLLELERGRKADDIQGAPVGAMELFMKLAELCRHVDAFLTRRGAVSSPMLKAQLFGEGLERVEQLQAAQQSLATRRSELEQQLRDLNHRWLGNEQPQKPPALLAELEELSREFSFLARWSGQVQERLARLST